MAASASLLSMLGFAPASSRPWKATPITLAREYGQIIDTRGIGDIVIVSWMVPQGIPADSPGAAAMQAMLQHYVLMVTVHGQLDKTTGVVSFKDNEDFSVRDRNGKQLASVARESLPPTNIAMIGDGGGVSPILGRDGERHEDVSLQRRGDRLLQEGAIGGAVRGGNLHLGYAIPGLR
jgi:hypothetical protein